MVLTDTDIKDAYAERLRKEGLGVSIDVPADEHGGTIDILTERKIIFCAVALTTESAIALKSQLNFYSKFAPSREKIAVVQQVVDVEAASELNAAGITIVNISLPDTLRLRSQPRSQQQRQKPISKKIVYRYPALDSVEGGDGLPFVAIAFAIVFLIGLIGIIGF